MIFDQFDPTSVPTTSVRSAPVGTASENFFAAMKRYDYVDSSIASRLVLRDIWDPIVAEVNEATGSNFVSPLYAGEEFSGLSGDYQGQALSFFDFVKKAESEKPGSISPKIMELMSLEAMDAAVISEAQRAVSEYDAVSINSEGFINGAASFLGSLAAGSKDPFNVALMLGTMGVGTGINGAKTLAGIALREALINGGGEALKQPLVASWYKEIGLNYTADNFISNVGGAAVIGGALPIAGAAVKAGAGAVSRGIDIQSGVTRPTRALIDFLDAAEPELNRTLSPTQMLAGVETLKSGGIKISRESQAAVTAAQDLLDLEASNPISGNPVGTIVDHASTMASAQHSLFNGEVPKIKAVPIEMVKPEAILQQADNLDGFVFRFNPNEIGVDAKTFQFKMGGDAFGVSERLRGVKVWDPILGGEILVYEYADGRMFVADGHQRLGLAKRIMSEDPAQNVVIYGRKLREADGVTPEQAMVVAAIKNIAEGSGSAIDAAKVARIDPVGFSSLIGKTLPPSSVLVRQANDMINLTDNAFGAIINEVIPANYGAIIGRVLGDRKDLQDAAVKILAKSEPANVFQAEAIVRQVREADAEQVQQFSLFGEETVTESLFVERAKILDQAYRQLKQDKATFANLTRNADRIEAEGGNVLDRQLNEQKATQDAQTIALLQTLANRKGPVSDALSAAARAFRDTGSYGRPTRDFLESVRNAIATGDLDRISSSDIGRTLDGPSPGSADTVGKEPVLDGFEEPNGVAAEQQIDQLTQDMFPEPVAMAEAAATGTIEELKSLIDAGADFKQIDQHPVVLQAIKDMESRPQTVNLDGYGSEDWHNTRAYTIDKKRIVGTEDAFAAWEMQADRLAWVKKGLQPEPVALDRQATIILGPPAAGKSTIAEDFAIFNKAAIIDSDEIKASIPEFDNGIGAAAVHEESSSLAKELMDAMLKSGRNVVIPKVGDKASSILKQIQLLKDNGYTVFLIDMSVTPQNAKLRMYGRFVSNGRLIPPAYVDAVGNLPSGVYRELKQQGAADGFAQIDNNGKFGAARPITDKSGQDFLSGSPLDMDKSGGDIGGAANGIAKEPSQAVSGEVSPRGEAPVTSQVSEMQSAIMDELQPDDMISVGLMQDANGNIVSQTMTMAEMKTMLDAEDEFIKQLGICGI
jgi:predicted ABC-type ATPase